jgi:hypothetical protein
LKPFLWNFENASSSQLSLQVNRLSGKIPPSLQYVKNLKLLKSNLFSCDIDSATLPKYDHDRKIYECGSNPFLVASYLGIASSVIILFLILVLKLYFKYHRMKLLKRFYKSYLRMIDVLKCYDKDFLQISDSNETIVRFGKSMEQLRWFYGCLSFYIVFILLPLFGILSTFYGKYKYGYAWTVLLEIG